MRKTLAVVTAVLVAMLGAAHAASVRDRTVIRGDRGGWILKYEWKFFRFNTNTLWAVDGECLSACTMVLGTGRVCVTPRARFGFHAGSATGFTTNHMATQQMYRRYPDWVQGWVDRSGAMRTLKITYMPRAIVYRHIPRC